MFGRAADIVEFRAALLASRGFAALALPYFNYEDVPKHAVLNLEYFEVLIVKFEYDCPFMSTLPLLFHEYYHLSI